MIPEKSRQFIEPFHRYKMIFLFSPPPTMPPRKKVRRNLQGLRNQPKQGPTPSTIAEDSEDNSHHTSMPGMHFDSMKVDWENDNESDHESEIDLDDFEDEEFGISLLKMAEKEDSKDLDWLPPRLRVLQKERKGV
jgi:hypothetical protein